MSADERRWKSTLHTRIALRAAVCTGGRGRAECSCESPLACRYCNSIGDTYTLGKVLGKGQFGTTRIAVHKETGEKYACKTVSKRKIVSKQVRQTRSFSYRVAVAELPAA